MKKPLIISAAILAALSLSSCREKKQQEDIIVDKIVEKPKNDIKTALKPAQSNSVKWIDGKQYSYSIEFAALDTIAPVENYGEKYYDNVITLTVRRSDGSEVCRKEVTKRSFSGLLSKDMKDNGVLLSMVLDKSDNNYLHFVASVGSPDETNEDFVLLGYSINRFGESSVSTYTPPAEERE